MTVCQNHAIQFANVETTRPFYGLMIERLSTINQYVTDQNQQISFLSEHNLMFVYRSSSLSFVLKRIMMLVLSRRFLLCGL